MATLTIRNLDDDTKARLRVDAALNGRSMEEHARVLLGEALRPKRTERTGGLGTWIHSLVADLDDAPTLEIGLRADDFRPVDFS